jgi:hypothetical protein
MRPDAAQCAEGADIIRQRAPGVQQGGRRPVSVDRVGPDPPAVLQRPLGDQIELDLEPMRRYS